LNVASITERSLP